MSNLEVAREHKQTRFFKELHKEYRTLDRKGKLELHPRSESSAILSRKYIRER